MSTTSAPTRSYAEAINHLNSLQSNAAVIEAIRKSGGKGGEQQVVESLEYLKRIGYSASDLNPLNVIHITGTKGKGSTSAFTDSVLRSIEPAAKVGLYTSPHLVAVRERIRINGKPIKEDLFAKYFWEVWDRLEANNVTADPDTPEKPAYFRYLTIMAFHVFLQEKVDATILEVGVGGTYDSTNIVPKPLATGVTSLGIDHIFVLGKTIPEIAAQKGGIYKLGVPALAIKQPDEGLDVLRARATELRASSFNVVEEIPQLLHVKLGLAGRHQRINASLAVSLVQTFLSSPSLPLAFKPHTLTFPPLAPATSTTLPELPAYIVSPAPLPPSIVEGLHTTSWPGRCQIVPDGSRQSLTWYLDGAHTVESLACCSEWFEETSFCTDSNERKEDTSRVLIFNCTSGRSGLSLLGALLSTLKTKSYPFQQVIFCTNTTYSSGVSKGDLTSNAVDSKELESLSVQHELAAAWEELTSSSLPGPFQAKVHVLSSIEDSVELVRGLHGEFDVLVTGSLHLVGGVMAVAEVGLKLD